MRACRSWGSGFSFIFGGVAAIAPVSRVAEMFFRDERYKIPIVTAISVGEISARKKPKYVGGDPHSCSYPPVSRLTIQNIESSPFEF